MDKTFLKTVKDSIINVNYDLAIIDSAKELADILKDVLIKNKIDFSKYNSYKENSFEKHTSIDNPPKEIYEYQNFFVLERINGDLVLLDGFRRLLWYKAPSAPILVRFYKEKDLDNQQILTLLVNLNHFKFFSDQAYHERGFSLLLKTVFDIDITDIKHCFDAYLSSKETKNSYSNFGELSKQNKNDEIKRRIINKFFISDLKFLKTLYTNEYLCDKYMGALLFEMRTKSEKEFDADKFISLIKKNTVLLELTDKYKNIGTNNSAKSQEIVNKIIEMYRNIFTLMEGGTVEQSFAEKQKECKDLVAKLKKDKNLTKLTGASLPYKIESEIEKRLKNKEDVKFICVVHPKEISEWGNKNSFILPHGLLDGVKYLKHTPKHLSMGNMELNIGIKIDDKDCVIWHNYGGYSSYGKKYTRLRMPTGEYDVDLFVCIPSKEIPK